MAALNVLVEAAKYIEYDEVFFFPDSSDKRKKSIAFADKRSEPDFRIVPILPVPRGSILYSKSKDVSDARRCNRETHNILEKNRRADMKMYFQKLKRNLPKLRNMVKASNVSILTEATKHIADLTATDKQIQSELERLRKCQRNLDELIRRLKEDIRRQHFCAQLFEHVQEEKRRASETSTSPKMMSVEIQANENEIKAEIPVNGEDIIAPRSKRNCLSDLRNNISQNGDCTEIFPAVNTSKVAATDTNFIGIENSPEAINPVDRFGLNEKNTSERAMVHPRPPKRHGIIPIIKRKRKYCENEDIDSDSDLKIITDD